MDGSVVVIGGSAGLGKAIASHYADAGHDVVVTSRDKARAEATAQEIGGSSRGIAGDLTRPAEIPSALAEIGPGRDLRPAALPPGQHTGPALAVAGATSP